MTRTCFNGAPRLGLGDGVGQGPDRAAVGGASMGLRDWVSEMVSRTATATVADLLTLQWGSETGSRRWPP